MKLNLQQMSKRQACFPGLEWWNTKFGEADVEYQTILNHLAEEDRVDWARWLINAVGPDDSSVSLLELRRGNAFLAGSLFDEESADYKALIRTLLVAGACWVGDLQAEQLVVHGMLKATKLTVEGNITAVNGDIIVTGVIDAENIRAGGNIFAGGIDVGEGTVRSNGKIQCDSIIAGSVLQYASGLKPDQPRRRLTIAETAKHATARTDEA